MSSIFISYSRKDIEFIRQLHSALVTDQYDVWVDWEDIPPSAAWLAEIYAGIEHADTFIAVLSPEYLASTTCLKEVDHAILHNKRLIPIVRRDIIASQVNQSLAELNWIFFRDNDPFDSKYKELDDAIKLDLDWVKAHTRLLMRAIEWNTKSCNDSFLMRGVDLEEAQAWLAQARQDKMPQPTALQKKYLAACEALKIREQQLEQARQRRLAEAKRRARRIIGVLVGFFSLLFATGILYLFPAQTHWQSMPAFDEYRRNLPLVITASASNPDLIYASNQTAGGLYRSIDGGRSWDPISSGTLVLAPVYAIAANQDTVYVTTPDGVFVSANRGANWMAAQLTLGKCSDQSPCALAINPRVATQAYVATSEKKLWTTDNQGQVWSQISISEMNNTPITALATDGAYLVAATNRTLWFRQSSTLNWQALAPSPSLTTTISSITMVGQRGRFLMALGAGGIGDADVTNNRWYALSDTLPAAFIYTVSASGEQFYASGADALYCKRFWTVFEKDWWRNLRGETPCPNVIAQSTFQ